MTNFLIDYICVLTKAIGADFKDNYDEIRFGKQKKPYLASKTRVKGILKRISSIFNRGYLVKSVVAQDTIRLGIDYVKLYIAQLDWIYGQLADDQSKVLLVNLCAFRALGFQRIKLPLNNPEHWHNIRQAEKLIVSDQHISTGFNNIKLLRMNLEDIGFPIEFFYGAGGVVTDFIEQQYRCVTENGTIECEEGDVVIDAGGCWGDTALYFAHKVGPHGRVASFEFEQNNISIFQVNLKMNPYLLERVRLYENAVWSSSEDDLYLIENGPGSQVVKNTKNPNSILVKTLVLRQRESPTGGSFVPFSPTPTYDTSCSASPYILRLIISSTTLKTNNSFDSSLTCTLFTTSYFPWRFSSLMQSLTAI